MLSSTFVDEMGYLPLDDLSATIFFQLVSARFERGSIILTSNKSYGDWGGVSGDPIIATAILDRLLHHSTTINIRGESYRLKDRRRGTVAGSGTGGDVGRAAFRRPGLHSGQNAPPKSGGAGLRSVRAYGKQALMCNLGEEFSIGRSGEFSGSSAVLVQTSLEQLLQTMF